MKSPLLIPTWGDECDFFQDDEKYLLPPPSPIQQAFLRAIAEHPDDDSSRLVYADWLEENGDPEKAGYVRVKVAYERLDNITHTWLTNTGVPVAAIDGQEDALSIPRGNPIPTRFRHLTVVGGSGWRDLSQPTWGATLVSRRRET